MASSSHTPQGSTPLAKMIGMTVCVNFFGVWGHSNGTTPLAIFQHFLYHTQKQYMSYHKGRTMEWIEIIKEQQWKDSISIVWLLWLAEIDNRKGIQWSEARGAASLPPYTLPPPLNTHMYTSFPNDFGTKMCTKTNSIGCTNTKDNIWCKIV